MKIFRKFINNLLGIFNLKITKLDQFLVLNRSITELDPLIDRDFRKIYKKIEKEFGKADPTSSYTVYNCLKHIIQNKIKGDLVECGVFKGKMIAVMIETLNFYNSSEKNIYLYDTFEGMTPNSEVDKHVDTGQKNQVKLEKGDNYCDIESVQKNLENFNYDEKKIFYIKGDVKETLEGRLPDQISLLRLDTDFYESSLIELEKLYPKVNNSGFVIYDDYGHWIGQKKATDEFFTNKNIKPFLVRTSRKERLEVKKLSTKN